MDITTEAELEQAIAEMESRHRHEGREIINDFNLAVKNLQPFNMLKNILTEATASPEIKDNIVNTTVGMATGYLAKLFFNGKTAGPARKIIGNGLMFGISNIISNNPDTVRLAGNTILSVGKHLFKKEKLNGTQQHVDYNNED